MASLLFFLILGRLGWNSFLSEGSMSSRFLARAAPDLDEDILMFLFCPREADVV